MSEYCKRCKDMVDRIDDVAARLSEIIEVGCVGTEPRVLLIRDELKRVLEDLRGE